MSNYLIAQVFGTLGIISSVVSMQLKKRNQIVSVLLLLNLFSALNFLFLGNYAGSYVCFFAVLETFINYLFERKEKDVPIYVIIIYMIINILLGLITYTGLMDIIPIICALLFCLTVCSKKESNIRKLMLGNQSLWLIFDIYVKAYMFSISNILTIISILIAMYRYDRKTKKK